MTKQTKTEVPNTAPKPTKSAKDALADKTKAMTTGNVVTK